ILEGGVRARAGDAHALRRSEARRSASPHARRVHRARAGDRRSHRDRAEGRRADEGAPMTYRTLSVLPWLGAIAVLMAGVAGADDVVMLVPLDAVRLVAAAGCAAAALAFEQGERLR